MREIEGLTQEGRRKFREAAKWRREEILVEKRQQVIDERECCQGGGKKG